jgi:hypothetical protein
LTWKALLRIVMNKAYRAFWTCKAPLNKTWDLKPTVVHWIYTMVIKPTLTYSSTVWWQKVRYLSRTDLSQLQRLACLAIREAMEVLLGHPSLHMTILMEAKAGIYRLMCNREDLNPLTFITPKNLGTWIMNPSHTWGLTG